MTQPADTSAADELAAMRRIVVTLDRLDHGAQIRVVAWMFERFLGASHVVGPSQGGDRG